MLPGEVLADDPFSAVQAQNAQMLAEVGGAPAAPTPSTQIGPPGLVPQQPDLVVTEGLPSHLTTPASTYFPPPGELSLAGEPTPGHASATREEGMPPDLREAAPGDKRRCGTCRHFKAGRCDKYGDTAVRADEVCSGYEANDDAPQDTGATDMQTLSAEHQAVIYNTQGLNLAVAEDEDGLIWKVACKTGTLALSPGPGQTDVEKPLQLTGDLFDDMLLSFQEKAFPYVTVPETHANGSLENTGYVRKAEAITRDELLADSRFADLRPETRTMIANDPKDTRYLLAGIEFTEPDVKQKALNGSIPDTSIGVKFGYRNKRTGKEYKAAWEHLALTPMPWVDGLVPFGLSQQGKPVDAEEVTTPYDGVYIGLDTRISASGEFDMGSATAAIQALKPGDTWSWDYAVTVQALATAPDNDADSDESGDDTASEVMYLLTGDSGVVEVGAYTPTPPVLYEDVEDLMPVVQQRVTACEARRALQRAKYEATALSLADVPDKERKKLARKGLALPDGSFPIRNAEDLDNAIRAIGRASDPAKAKAHIKKRAKALGLESKIPDQWNLSQDGPVHKSEDLSTQRPVGELPGELHASQIERTSHIMPQTVEELLASQQAELELSQQRIRELEETLSQTTGQLSQQGQELHKAAVDKRVAAMQKAGYSPALCVAAKQIFLGDTSRIVDGENGLNLSVQTPTGEDGQTEERTLQSPSDVVEYLLSAIPTGEDAGAQAAANLREGLAGLQLSAQEDANSEEAARAAVEELERKRHPERFNDDGTRK